MAMYHFSLHKDKKPDGTKVAATEHVSYIKREGKYKNPDKEPENIIRGPGKDPMFEGKPFLLYRSNYGDITNTPNGLLLSGNVSPTTIGIAMMVAQRIYPDGINVTGSDRFKARAIRAAVDSNLDVNFQDEMLGRIFKDTKEKMENERREYQRNGGRIRRASPIRKPNFNCNIFTTTRESQTFSFETPSLRRMSERCMAGNGSEDTDVLLPGDAHSELEVGSTESSPPVRWRDDRGRGRLIKDSADRIVKNVEKYKEQIFAESHVEYINREAAFEKKGGCIYTDHRLPKWADDSPNKFFKAADRYEGKGNVRYLEFQFALPNELTLDQNLELIHNFIEKEIMNQYYTFAIHDKVGSMSDGAHNLHVHLMFSERTIDDAEKEKERRACHYFSYPKRGAKSLDEKRQGGAPRERRFAEKWFLSEARKDYADITNAALEKYGCPDRVDHRSIKAMKKEAEMNGDTYLAKILTRIPERSLGPTAALIADSPDVNSLKRYRRTEQNRQNIVFEEDILQREIKEIQSKKRATDLAEQVRSLMEMPEYRDTAELDQDDYLYELKQDFLEALKDVRGLKKSVLWTAEALEDAKVAFLSEADREYWQRYRELSLQLKNWETFSDSIDLDKIEEAQKKDYLKLLSELDKKMDVLEARIMKLQPHFNELEDKLEEPPTPQRIQQYAQRMLQEDRHTRQMYDRAHDHLATALRNFRQALTDDTDRENNQELYTTKELYAVLRKRYFGLKKEYEQAWQSERKLKSQVISPERATEIAEDVFCKGEWKKLRADLRQLSKDEKYLANDFEKLEKEKISIASEPLSAAEKSVRLFDYAKQEKTLLARSEALKTKNASLSHAQDDLRARCEQPEAKRKIADIALGVIRKNHPVKVRYETAVKYTKHTLGKMQTAKAEMQAVKEQMSYDTDKTRYKVITPQGGYHGSGYNSGANNPSTIAEAIMKTTAAVNVVARSRDDSGLEKSWQMMTVFERDEQAKKAILRDL